MGVMKHPTERLMETERMMETERRVEQELAERAERPAERTQRPMTS